MNIRFRDISRGVVEARASIEITSGVYVNEISVIKKGKELEIEFPQKSFRSHDGGIHYVDLITFENEQKRIIWSLEIKDAYLKWRERNKPVLVYRK